MALTKADVVQNLMDHNGYTRTQASELLETLLELIKTTLSSGEDVMVSNFGKFQVREKAQRRGRNPATGQAMLLEPRRVVTFQCARKLRETVNGK
ncbi:MAG: integration host factor subunit alpha [Desulfobacterales bacterium]|nr:integration host factor subunit alpha [Desulfobacterales bacterium]